MGGRSILEHEYVGGHGATMFDLHLKLRHHRKMIRQQRINHPRTFDLHSFVEHPIEPLPLRCRRYRKRNLLESVGK